MSLQTLTKLFCVFICLSQLEVLKSTLQVPHFLQSSLVFIETINMRLISKEIS